jgi:hypothetical protein
MPKNSVNSVIDDEGKLWDTNSRDLKRQFYALHYQGDFAKDAIRNLGFIGVSNSGDALHVSLRPSKVSALAFATMMYWLHDQNVDRVMISFLTDTQQHEIKPSRILASERLCELRTVHFVQQTSVLAVEKAIDSIEAESPLLVALRLWRSCAGILDKAFILAQLRAPLGGRLVIVEPVNSELVMTQIGLGMHWPNQGCVAPLEGSSVLAHPDPIYGRWVEQSYSSVLRGNKPRLDDVDAFVTWPHLGQSRRQYRRLILPFTDTNGRRLLVGATCLDAQLDLRLKVA